MKKILYSLGLLLVLNACVTVGMIERNCDKYEPICVREANTVIEYRDTTIFKTDTVYWALPADTLKITDTLKIENNRVDLPPLRAEFDNIVVEAGIVWPVLNVAAWYKDSTLLIPRIDTILIADALSNKTTIKTVVVEKELKTWFTKLATWWFFISLIIFIIIIGVNRLLSIKHL